VECSDRTLSVFLKVVEIRSIETVGHPIKNAQVQFQGFFNLVKDPAEETRVDIACHFLHFPITQKIDIQFGPHLLQSPSKGHAEIC